MELYSSSQAVIPPVRPKTWLVESILVTICCCIVFGIVSLVFSSQVNARYDLGDYDAAQRYSNEAGKWIRISLIIAVVFWVLYFLFIFLIGGAAFWTQFKGLQNV